MSIPPERAQWTSERAFILTTTAAAVGLGNLWRFPYMVGENGGGAFIIAYVLAVAMVGMPLMLLELAAGRRARGSPVAMFRYLHPRATAVGWLIVGLTIIIMSYYLVITGWTLGYTVISITGGLQPFSGFTAGYASFWYFLIVILLTGAILLRGLSGLEQTARLLMPVLVGIVLILAIYGLTLPGRQEAMAFLFTPDFGALREPRLWLFAFGQAFYSLGVGQGMLITYGSYLPDRFSLQRPVLAVTGVETMIALLAGVMLFPMVFTFGFAPDSGSELAFNTLPAVFGVMPGGPALAVVFFALFFAAALSSCVAGMKIIIAAVEEEFRLQHASAVYVGMGAILVLGIPSALSYTPISLTLAGRPFLVVMDLFAATQVIVASGIIGAGLISWLIPRERMIGNLGDRWRARANFVITIGRYLALPVVAVLLYAWMS